MLNDDSVFIPVDDAIDRFHNHLLSHERIVLSAKFGDGKSFFLNEFKKKCANDDNSPYEFITLYPVNYQVLENKDIFELIKHDVLLQILQLGIIRYLTRWHLPSICRIIFVQLQNHYFLC